MQAFHFNDLQEKLKVLKQFKTKVTTSHPNGVFRSSIHSTGSLTVIIEYLDFGSTHVPLNFITERDGGAKTYYKTAESLLLALESEPAVMDGTQVRLKEKFLTRVLLGLVKKLYIFKGQSSALTMIMPNPIKATEHDMKGF